MKAAEFAKCDATALAEHVHKGDVTPQEMLDTSLKIIESLNPKLNAVVGSMKPEASQFIQSDLQNTPFKGVPMGIKDDESIHYAGVPTGNSNLLCKDMVMDRDTELMARYKKVGLNAVAKTNLPEFSASVTTESTVNGICKNPWDLERTVGGSSGGSACGIAAGMFPVAYGNDGAGSIRIPASCCGVFGVKPTRARMPKGPYTQEEWNGLVTDHVLTKSVRDSAAIMDHTAGIDIGAPYDAPPAEHSFLSQVGAVKKPYKIAVLTKTFTGQPIHTDCKEAVLNTATLCEELGHTVEEAYPTCIDDKVYDIVITLMKANSAYGLGELFKHSNVTPSSDWVDNTNYRLYEAGLSMTAVEFVSALNDISSLSHAIAPFFEKYDFLLTPVTTQPAVKHGIISPLDEDLGNFITQFKDFAAFTPFTNITGQPAMSVPLSWNADGIPIGSHFVTKFGCEAKLFQLAGQLEQARPWHDKQPPIHANTI